MHLRRINRILVPLLLVSACASGPVFDTSRVDRSLAPRSDVAGLAVDTQKNVLWGGAILSTTNLEHSTRIEVQAYPLDAYNAPRIRRDPLGRFILEYPGYLEPAIYTEGRLITLVGAVTRTLDGKVDDAAYTYPVVVAEQIYLWPRDRYRDRPRTYLGIGIGMGIGF